MEFNWSGFLDGFIGGVSFLVIGLLSGVIKIR